MNGSIGVFSDFVENDIRPIRTVGNVRILVAYAALDADKDVGACLSPRLKRNVPGIPTFRTSNNDVPRAIYAGVVVPT
jgi:hypothetical protein